ncbi:hypothetical protein BD413DRAFT_236778 [Trametes elegans]|nr:hypothetical protein BD413DRAFT_236778 [Trametes elegans]
MSTQYGLPPSANLRTMESTRLQTHAPSKSASYHPSMSQRSSRRVPVQSASLPQSSCLSDVAEFAPPPPQHDYLGVTVPVTDSFLSSGWTSDSGSPSRSPHRARPREHFPSSPQPSGSRSPARLSPIPQGQTRKVHTSRSFSASSPLKTSAFSDRDASGHLDFKRLMSKPAKQSASASSMVSLPSDSEHSASASSGRLGPSRRPSEPVPHPPPLRNIGSGREKLSLHVNTTELRTFPTLRQARTPSPVRRPETSDGQPAKPARNVLRRRASARSNPSGNPPRAQTDDNLPPLRTMSSKPRLEQPASSSSRQSPSPSGYNAATPPRKMSAPTPSKPPEASPRPLTPASAVALAYMQQEQRREELAETASFNDAYRPPLAQPTSANTGALPMRPVTADVPRNRAEEEGGEPYYTVFGGSSGRVVAMGSPMDDDWHIGTWDTRVTIAAAAGSGHKHHPVNSRSLSRKVSGSFKRVAESIKREKELRDPLARTRGSVDWRAYEDLRQQNGHDNPSRGKTSRKPLPLVPLDTTLEGRNNSPRGSPVPKYSSTPEGSPSPQEDGRGSRTSRVKGKERTEELSPSGMWSKLIKRISTGGLREKYNHSNEAPPPVPALPPHIPKPSATRMTMEIPHTNVDGEEVSENGVLLRRFMQSRTSLSGVRPSISSAKASSSSSSRPSTGTAGRPSTGNTTKSRASLGQRPNTAPRSPSPGSSEPTSSSGIFYHNHTASTRSSFSSLGEEIPPMPHNLGQFIVSPSELSRMAKMADAGGTPTPSRRSRKTSRSQSAPVNERVPLSATDDGLIPSLPLPPRRATEGSSTSPLVSSFTGDDIATGADAPGSGPPPLAEFGMKEAPPRPKRSSRRGPPPNVDVPPRSQSMSVAMPRSPATPRGPPAVRVDVNLARCPSTGALSYASTARQLPVPGSSSSPSSGASPSSAASQKRSPLMFRELESPRQKLSEKEKAAKWEDLLERSERAGGTLRVGDSGLLSEHPDTGDTGVRDSVVTLTDPLEM